MIPTRFFLMAIFGASVLLAGCSEPTAVQGRVTDEKKYPVAGATVSMEGEDAKAITNEAGAFTLEQVPTGERSLTVSKPGYAPAEQEFSVVTKPVTVLNEAIRITPYTFSGKVSLGNDIKDHSGVLVYLPGTERTALTDAAGRFEFHGLPQASYKVRVSKEDYSTIVFQVSTTEATAYDLPFTIQLPRKEKR